MPNIGPLEIAIVLIIVLAIFGPKRLPELGHGIGRGMREFKAGISGKEEEGKPAVTEVAASPTTTAVAAAGAGVVSAAWGDALARVVSANGNSSTD